MKTPTICLNQARSITLMSVLRWFSILSLLLVAACGPDGVGPDAERRGGFADATEELEARADSRGNIELTVRVARLEGAGGLIGTFAQRLEGTGGLIGIYITTPGGNGLNGIAVLPEGLKADALEDSFMFLGQITEVQGKKLALGFLDNEKVNALSVVMAEKGVRFDGPDVGQSLSSFRNEMAAIKQLDAAAKAVADDISSGETAVIMGQKLEGAGGLIGTYTKIDIAVKGEVVRSPLGSLIVGEITFLRDGEIILKLAGGLIGDMFG